MRDATVDPAIANLDLDPPVQPSVLSRWLVPALLVNALFVVALVWSTPWSRVEPPQATGGSPADLRAMGGPTAAAPVEQPAALPVQPGGTTPGTTPAPAAAAREAVAERPSATAAPGHGATPPAAVRPSASTAPVQRDAAGPSFDCAKARSRPEKLICADPELARLDRELGRLNVRARALSPDPVAFRRAGDGEWKRREAECRDKACLLAWFAHRREQLQALVDGRG